MRITADDVKPMVDQMIELLSHRPQRSRRRRVGDWFQGHNERDDQWRAHALTFFSELRRRLEDRAERFDDEAAHLHRWMDWDSDLERQAEEIRALAPRIQQALGLLERFRATRPAD